MELCKEEKKEEKKTGLIGKLQLQELQVVCCLPKRIYLQESHQDRSVLSLGLINILINHLDDERSRS